MPFRALQRDLFGRSSSRPALLTRARELTPAERLARGFRRRWPLAALAVLLCLGMGLAALACLRPVYRASEELQAQNLPPLVRWNPAAPAARHTSSRAVQSFAEELGSRDLVDAAVRSLPPSVRSALPLRRFARPRWLAAAWDALLQPRPPAAAAMRQLHVAKIAGSRLIGLSFDANGPRRAEAFLRALAAAEQRRRAARQRQFGIERVAALTRLVHAALSRARAAETKFEAAAARGGLPDPAARLALARQRWRQFAAAQTAARIRATQRAAALAAGALPATPASPDGAPAIPAALLAQRDAQAATVARLARIYRPQAAPLVQARTRLASLNANLRALRQGHTAALRRSLASARAQAASLRQAMQAQAARQPPLRAGAAALSRAKIRLQTRQDAYAALLRQLAQAAAEVAAAPPPLRTVASARSPRRPLSPRPAPLLAEALILGGLLAAAALWTAERWDDALRLPEAAELGLPLLAVLPREANRESPSPAYHRGLETAAAGLLRAHREIGVRTVLITSPTAATSHAALALALARRLAQLSPDVLLVDAHGAAPELASATPERGGPQTPGLAEVLAGQCSLADALHPVSGGLVSIAAGQGDPRDLMHLASGDAGDFLAAAAARYAWVVIDGPPDAEGPEAVLWAGLADLTVVVAAAGLTARRHVRQTLDAFEQSGATGLALILSHATAREAAAARPVWPALGPRGDDAAMRQRA
jgi:uncharacterized protein involved in exopolysaccharide biosynthesis